MLKKDLVNLLVAGIEVESVYFKNKYGVGSGVAYDMIVNVKINGALHELQAHALKASWALVGWLRPNISYNIYKGSNNKDYTPSITDYWMREDKQALKEYYNRFTKKELQEMMELSK